METKLGGSMERLTIEQIKQFPNTSFGRAIGKKLTNQCIAELLEYKRLEAQIGCPLEVRCKVVNGTEIYDASGNEFVVEFVSHTHFGGIDTSLQRIAFGWNNYKKFWWLKPDKSE